MKKSFKKAIAAILAVLMVVCTMPFTALAAPGDYAPDVRLQFGTCYPGASGNWQDYSGGTASGADFSLIGLYDVPVDFNYTIDKATGAVSGNLYIDKNKANKASDTLYANGPFDEDIQYGVGDYFTVTVMIKDLPSMAAGQINLTYSDNIEPACYYSYKDGRAVKYAMGTVSDCAAATSGAVVFGGEKPITAQSATALHQYLNDENATKSTAKDGIIECQTAIEKAQNGADLVTGIWDEYYCDPETGDMSTGYTYYGLIWETFMFKITGEGPITFAPQDPDNSIMRPFGYFYVIAQQADGGDPADYTTYAINKYNTITGNYDVPENPGSAKMTFFGYNANVSGGSTDEHEHSWEGATPVYAGNGQHKLVCTAADCPDRDAEEAIKLVDCTKVSANNAVAPDCVTDGKEADTICSVCNGTITEGAKINKTEDHNYTAVSNNDGTHTFTCAYGYTAHNQTEDCNWGDVIEDKAPTYTEAGAGHQICADCGQSKDVVIPVKTHEHSYTVEVADSAVAATCEKAGKAADMKCELCDDVKTGAEIPALGHKYVADASTAVAATCETAGKEADQVCANDASHVITGKEIAATGHKYVADATTAVAATCETAGKEADQICANDASHVITGKEIAALGHEYVEDATTAVAATCETAGKEADKVCANDASHVITGKEIAALGHNYVVDETTAVAPTLDAPGKEADKVCANDPSHVIPGAEIAQLVGYTVTIDGAYLDMGTVTLNGEAVVDEGAAIKVEAGSVINLEATPVDGAKFVGWIVNGKTTISTEAAHSANVRANITYTPVFEIVSADKFTVKFVDAYSNIVSIQTVADASEIVVPAAPTRPGYTAATENGWNMTAAEIAALTADAVITAQYTSADEVLYTVTAPEGAVITVNGAEVEGNVAKVPFDTKVTVTKAGTEAWTINGVNVAYGDSYTFFVTASVELGTAAGITATPTVAAVSQEEIVSGGITKVIFTATRTMAPGYKYINSGFVYGKNAAADIELKDVDGKAVKAVYNKTDAEQFNLTYGLSAQSGTMTVRAFIVYADAAGNVSEAYAEGPLTSYSYKD